MRVALVQLTDFPEAGRVDIYEYSQALARLGLETHVIICKKNNIGNLPANLYVHELNLSTNPGPINAGKFVEGVLAEIATLQPLDLIHLFNPAPATFLLGRALRRRYPHSKIIYDVRTGGLGYGFDSLLINTMARRAISFADGIITISPSLYRRLYGQKKLRQAVVPLGVATDRFVAAKQPRGHSGFTFVYLGSLAPIRQLPKLFEAFRLAYEQEPKLRLKIVGGGPNLANIEKIVSELSCKDAVNLVGAVPFSEVPSQLLDSDCGLAYVPITPWFNPQPPLKTLEYLSCNLPVVATATDSQRELWGDLPRELLCQDSSQDFSQGLLSAYRRGSDLGRVNWRAVALPFDWQAITANDLLPFYKKVISS